MRDQGVPENKIETMTVIIGSFPLVTCLTGRFSKQVSEHVALTSDAACLCAPYYDAFSLHCFKLRLVTGPLKPPNLGVTRHHFRPVYVYISEPNSVTMMVGLLGLSPSAERQRMLEQRVNRYESRRLTPKTQHAHLGQEQNKA